MNDDGLGECERRSSSSNKSDIRKLTGSGVLGLPSSTLLFPLFLFLLHHLLLILLFDPLQLVGSDSPTTPRIVVVDLGRRAAELFSILPCDSVYSRYRQSSS